MFPAAKRRREFPCGHQEREVPRDDLAAHAQGLAQSVVEHLAGHRDGLALDLGGIAREVFKIFDDLRQIDVRGFAYGLAVVGGFQCGQLRGMLFDQLRELIEQTPAITRAHL